MRNRRRARFLRRLVLGFAVALVAVPAAQAAPDEGGEQAQKTFIPGVSDFPSSSAIAADQGGLVVQGERKDGLGVASRTAAVLTGDDKRGLPATRIVPVGHPDNRVPGTRPSPATIRIVVPTADTQYNQYAYRRALPGDHPLTAALAGLDAETRGYVAGAAPTAAAAGLAAETRDYVAGAAPVVSGPAQVVSSDGFDWGDAGIGAGVVFAIMLLGAGAVLVTRHVSRPASV